MFREDTMDLLNAIGKKTIDKSSRIKGRTYSGIESG